MADMQRHVWTDYPFDDLSRELVVELEVTQPGPNPDDVTTLGVVARIFFAEAPGNSYTPPPLAFNRRVPLFFSFDNGEDLRGWLVWSNTLRTARSEQIMGRVQVIHPSRKRDWHYEGFLVDFGPSVIVPQPDPDPDPDPRPRPDGPGGLPMPAAGPAPLPAPNALAELPVEQVHLTATDLFPFLYIEPWPSAGAELLSREFVGMPKGLTSQTKFLTDLEALRTAGNPAAMRAAAIAFIDAVVDPDSRPAPTDGAGQGGTGQGGGADSPDPTEFISRADQLPAPFQSFPAYWEQLDPSGAPSFQTACQIVKTAFGGWPACRKALALQTVAPALGRIWASLVALNLVLGYRHDLLTTLGQVLVVYHTLLQLSEFMTAPAKGGSEPQISGPDAAAELEKQAFLKQQAAPRPDANGSDHGEPDTEEPAPPVQTAPPDPAPTPELDDLVRQLASATVVLPGAIFPLAEPSADAAKGPNWVQPYALGAARAVRYRPLGYDLGDVQRIENVLRGETRERSARNLTRFERQTRSSETDEELATRQQDVSTADLVHQVQKTLSDHVTRTNINNYDTTYGMPTTNKMGVSGEWWVQEQPAGGFLKDTARFARDVLDQTVRRITREVSRTRAECETSEFESREISRFENVNGEADICGIYRWVNRIFRLETHNLGQRLILEFVIDDPARHLLAELSRYHQIDLRPPPSPEDRGICGYADLSDVPVTGEDGSVGSKPDKKVHYLDAFEWFDVADDLPPPEANLTTGKGVLSRAPLAEVRVPVPEGYDPGAIKVQVTSFRTGNAVEVVAGGQSLTPGAAKGNGQGFSGTLTAADVTQDDPVSGVWVGILSVREAADGGANASGDSGKSDPGSGSGDASGGSDQNSNANQPDAEVPVTPGPNVPASDFAANVSISCQRRTETLADWQYRAYRLVRQGYARQLERFRLNLEAQRARLEAENPRFLTDAVNDQVVQACVAALYEQHLALTGMPETAGKPATSSDSKDSASVNLPPDMSAPRVFQYLRNVLLWSELHVQLYLGDTDADSMAMSEGETALLETLLPARQFRNFLSAKRARVMVPARPEWMLGLLYFLRTGMIWPEADRFTPCVEQDRPLVAEIKRAGHFKPSAQAPTLEDSWDVCIPTSMVMLASERSLPTSKEESAA